MAQVALAWTLSKDFISAPIVGTTSLKNLEDLIGGLCSDFEIIFIHIDNWEFTDGLKVVLTEEEVKSIDEPYQAKAIMGHW